MKKRLSPRWLQRVAPKVGKQVADHLRIKAESYPNRSLERNHLIAQAKEFEFDQGLESMRLVEEVLTGRWTKDWGKDFNKTPNQLFEQLQRWLDLESEKDESGWENPYIEGLKWSNKVSGGWTKE